METDFNFNLFHDRLKAHEDKHKKATKRTLRHLLYIYRRLKKRISAGFDKHWLHSHSCSRTKDYSTISI